MTELWQIEYYSLFCNFKQKKYLFSLEITGRGADSTGEQEILTKRPVYIKTKLNISNYNCLRNDIN
ncbi:Uncharacterised protein [uncultured archaeon]|nr:Uncharacterised protein [uncultured archaeon]